MIDRFTGASGERLLRQCLMEQQCVAHDSSVVDEMLKVLNLLAVKSGQRVLTQGEHDNDIYLILAGRLAVYVNNREIGIRHASQHVGEMALIDPSARRSATVVALEASILAKISEPDFASISEKCPEMWRRLAKELAQRLREREKFVRAPNPRPVIFIGSSVEGLQVAKYIQLGLAHLDAVVYTWANNVFSPGHYTMQDLERQIQNSDFGLLVFTQDDQVVNIARDTDTHAPRDNVVLELGMCIGCLGHERSFVVKPKIKELKIPTDLLGITTLEYRGDDAANLSAHLGSVCTTIEQIVTKAGPR